MEKNNILFIKYCTTGFIVEENAGFVSVIMDSIEQECRNKNYNLNVLNSNNLNTTFESIPFEDYEGIIILGTELDTKGYTSLETLKHLMWLLIMKSLTSTVMQ